MPRKLKFRVWDKILKQFLFDHRETGLFFSRHKNISLGDLSVSNYFNDKDSIIQQYTGLKDKNGVEIYEGDVVKYHADFNFGDIVTFSNGCFFIGDATINELIHRGWDNFEIVGNVFENPSLLGS